MSKRIDYDSMASRYDSGRCATGSDLIAAMMQFYCQKPLKDMHVLDAGCGTGNYTKALIEYGVGHVTLLDASRGMLEKARSKLSEAIKHRFIQTVEYKIPPLPFADVSFDVVMFNFVLNHLDKGDGEFPTVVTTLKEARRVLRSDGILVISTVLRSTADSMWFTRLSKDMSDRYKNTMPSLDQFQKMFAASGLQCVQKMNILGSELFKTYHNYEGPLDETWRKDYVYWINASEEELSNVKQKLEEIKHNGTLKDWAKEHDRVNTEGLMTLLVCKPVHKFYDVTGITE